MLLNYSAPRLAPNIVTPPKSNVDVNSILGLKASGYEGLQSVGDTGYFYGNNRMYEAYTPPPPTNYGGYYGIMGYSTPSNNTGLYGYQPPPLPSYESMTIDGQEFRTVSPEIKGFTRQALDDDKYQKDSVYEYTPSMAYVYSQAPKYQGNPQLASSPAINLTTPTANVYNGNYGAGRFLNTGNLLGFNFGTPSGQTAGGQTTT